MFKIREATSDDNPALLELLSEVLQLHASSRPDFYPDINTTFETVYKTDIYSDPSFKVFTSVTEDNIIVGYILFRINEPKPGINALNGKSIYIHELCVSEKYRKKYIGTQLVERAVVYGKSINAESIQLGVWEFNTIAISLYEKIGLRTITRRMEMKL